MKPRTKIQQKIWGLSEKLPRLSESHKQYAVKYCLNHLGYRTKKGITCMDCGNFWEDTGKDKKAICPFCSQKISIEITRKKNLSQREFMAIVTVSDEYQVIRFVEIYSHHRAGEKPRQLIWEVAQLFMKSGERTQIVARRTNYFFNNDNFSGDMEIRNNDNIQNYNLFVNAVYPGAKVLPIYKRNGFNGKFHGVKPYTFFSEMHNNNIGETLLKSKQYGLFIHSITSNSYKVSSHWSSIKIAIRNNYVIKDGIMYLDYLDLIKYYKKDMHSPVFVCPKNLKNAHDILVMKKRKEQQIRDRERERLSAIARAEQIIKNKEKLELEKQMYIEDKKAFIGLVFSKKNISIKVIESIEEFMTEGDIHNHCVYTNQYYRKKESLILSAKVDGVFVETVEVSLKDFQIVQSRGYGNKASEYNKDIINLVNKNMNVLKSRIDQVAV